MVVVTMEVVMVTIISGHNGVDNVHGSGEYGTWWPQCRWYMVAISFPEPAILGKEREALG
jgi:hypothetical protein